MSLRPNTLIEITQVPNDVYPDRSKTYTLDFCNYVEINTSWQNLTDTAKLKLPRNVRVENEIGTSENAWAEGDGGIYGVTGSKSPLFMRGDQIAISLGYFYDNMDGTETLKMPTDPQFKGYISKIKNRLPIEIECEDEMWKLKQIHAPNKLFKASEYNLSKMISEILKGTNYTVNDGGFDVSIGDFRIQNETVAQVLERLKHDGGFYFYFRGTELSTSGLAYNPDIFSDATANVQEVFAFQENIISDSLEYMRKEDLQIAIKVHTTLLKAGSGSNVDGTPKNKRERLEVLVGKINDKGDFGEVSSKETLRQDSQSIKFDGELIDRGVLGAKSKQDLIDFGKKFLPKFYYTGFRGSFLTFGQPTVTHGNAAIIRDNRIPERNGTYIIKQVVTTSGMQGFRQKITLHLRIDQGFTQDELNAGILG